MIESMEWVHRFKQLYASARASGVYYHNVYDDLGIAEHFISEHIVQEAELLGSEENVLSNPAMYTRLESVWLESFGK